VRATAVNPELRFASAREMNDAIEKLLDGDRDSTRRAEIAAEHTANARAALALARRGGPGADGQHRRAVGELLQAMALEPQNVPMESFGWQTPAGLQNASCTQSACCEHEVMQALFCSVIILCMPPPAGASSSAGLANLIIANTLLEEEGFRSNIAGYASTFTIARHFIMPDDTAGSLHTC